MNFNKDKNKFGKSSHDDDVTIKINNNYIRQSNYVFIPYKQFRLFKKVILEKFLPASRDEFSKKKYAYSLK